MSQSSGQKTLESMNQAKWYNQWLLGQFKDFLTGDILEIGCGIGNFTKVFAKYGNLTAIDIETEYIQKTQKIIGLNSKVGFGNIEANNFFFKRKKFDAIICLNVLEHIRDDSKALYNMSSLLKPGGRIILLVPAHQFLYGSIDRSIDHFRRYDKKSLIKMFKKTDLNVIKAKRLNLIGALGWFISGRILKEDRINLDKVRLFNLLGKVPIMLEYFIEPPIGISVLMIAQKNA